MSLLCCFSVPDSHENFKYIFWIRIPFSFCLIYNRKLPALGGPAQRHPLLLLCVSERLHIGRGAPPTSAYNDRQGPPDRFVHFPHTRSVTHSGTPARLISIFSTTHVPAALYPSPQPATDCDPSLPGMQTGIGGSQLPSCWHWISWLPFRI